MQAALGVVLLDVGGVTSLEVWQNAAIAGVTAVLSLVKTLAASKVGDGTAALPLGRPYYDPH